LLLFWHGWIGAGCVPFPLADSHDQKIRDYRVVFEAATVTITLLITNRPLGMRWIAFTSGKRIF